jgi:ABC-2 type transport system ATP-binding protein
MGRRSKEVVLGGDKVIEVRELVKVYGDRQVLKGISFHVNRNEVFGLLGENGAGKTTTLEIIEGLRTATSGSAAVLGMDSRRELPSIKERIGVQLQASAYFEQLTLMEILDLFRSFYGRGREPRELLSLVGLEDRGNMRVSQLSGGMRQRFSIVAALVNDPEVVFLDEPTTGLDPVARRNLWGLVRSIKEQGKTVVLTSHYLEEVEALCERVAIIKQGEILAMDTVAGLILRQENPVRMDFLPRGGLEPGMGERLSALGALRPSEDRAGEFTLFLKDLEGLRRALRETEGLELDRLSVSTANLEDVFVNLTGGRITGEEEIPAGRAAR